MTGTFLLDKIPEVVLILSLDKQDRLPKCLMVNEFACQIWGCTRDEFLARAVLTSETFPDTIATGESLVLTVSLLTQCHTFVGKVSLETYDGQECWICVGRWEDQAQKGRFPFEGEEIWTSLMESISDALIITDMDFRVRAWNRAASQTYGWKEGEAYGMLISEATPTQYVHQKRREVLKQFEETGAWEGEVRQQNRQGDWFYMHAVVNRLYDTAGNPIGAVSVNRDINQRKEAEEALKISQERLKLAGEVAYDLIYERDTLTNQLKWFGNIDRLLGYEPGSINNNQALWLSLIHPDDFSIIEKTLASHRVRTLPIELEYRVRHAHGHYLTWLDHAVPMLNKDGQPIKWVGVCTDITDQKKSQNHLKEREKLLLESEEKFSKAFMDHPVPMEILEVNSGLRVEINESFVRLLGYSKEELTGTTMYDLDLWVDDSRRVMAVESLKANGKIQDFPLDLRTKDGGIRHLLVSAAMLDTDTGDLAIVSLVDITLRKTAEESLRTSEAHLQTLVNTIPDMVFLKDPQGRFLWCNQRFASLLNTTKEGIIGKTDYDFTSELAAKGYRYDDERAIQARGPRITEEDFTPQTADQSIRVETIKTPMFDAEGKLVGVLGIARDITERVNHLNMLERQNSALKNISWMQSHEVRAPLSNIMGLISLMQSEVAPTPDEHDLIYQEIINASHDLDVIIRRIIHQTQEHLWALAENEKNTHL